MNDNTTIIITQVISVIGAILGAIVGAVLTNIFNKKNEEKLERREKEKMRREKIDDVYKTIRKFVRLLPVIAPKDILAKFDNTEEYNNYTANNVREILVNIRLKYLKENDCYDEYYDSINHFINELVVLDNMYTGNVPALKRNSFENQAFDLYAGDDVKLALEELLSIADSAFIEGKSGFILNTDQLKKNPNAEELNIMKDAKRKLDIAIKKDLGIM